jgi:hypothetical protein
MAPITYHQTLITFVLFFPDMSYIGVMQRA